MTNLPKGFLWVALLATLSWSCGEPEGSGPGENSDIPATACDELALEECLSFQHCVWNGSVCRGLDYDGAELMVGLPFSLWGHAQQSIDEGEHPTRLMLHREDDTLYGALTAEFDALRVTYPVRGELHGDAPRLSLEVFRPSCSARSAFCESLGDVDVETPLARLEGLWDSEVLAFSPPERLLEGAELPFLGLRFEPNDGVRPVRMPEPWDLFMGTLVGYGEGAPMEQRGCLLTFSEGQNFGAVVPEELSCNELESLEAGQGIDTESYAWSAEREVLWFRIELSSGAYLLVAQRTMAGLGGVIAGPEVWREGAPLLPSEIAAEDRLGVFLFQR